MTIIATIRTSGAARSSQAIHDGIAQLRESRSTALTARAIGDADRVTRTSPRDG